MGADAGWSLQEAALHGSSHYDLPGMLRWFTANIGIHHVHHLSSRIPYYRLPRVLRDHPELRDVGRITLLAEFSLRAARAVGRGARRPGVVPGNLNAAAVGEVVMPGLVPGIHVFATAMRERRGWPGQARP